MKKILVFLLILSLVVIYRLSPKNQLTTPDQRVVVAEVYDGDTFAFKQNGAIEKVRLIGIDTPETHKPDSPEECYGKEATQFLKNMIENRPVWLKVDPRSDNRDRYGRLLRIVKLEDGSQANEAIVAGGYGFAITGFDSSIRLNLLKLEEEARSTKVGLWQKCRIIDKGGYFKTEPLGL